MKLNQTINISILLISHNATGFISISDIMLNIIKFHKDLKINRTYYNKFTDVVIIEKVDKLWYDVLKLKPGYKKVFNSYANK